MANQKTLTNWILSQRARLDVQVKECSWISRVFPGWHDLDVTITANGTRFNGRGCDQSADTALSKAFCEAVERSVCHFHGIPSLGVAGHFEADKAKMNAKLEYLERRALFEHVSNGRQLKALALEPRLKAIYEDRGIKIDLYQLTSAGASVAYCLASGLESSIPFGGILGLGAHYEIEVASRKAIVECLQALEAFLAQASPSITHEQFTEIKTPNGLDRQALFRDRTYFTRTMNSLVSSCNSLPTLADGRYETLEISDSVLASCPLQFFRFLPMDNRSIHLEFVG